MDRGTVNARMKGFFGRWGEGYSRTGAWTRLGMYVNTTGSCAYKWLSLYSANLNQNRNENLTQPRGRVAPEILSLGWLSPCRDPAARRDPES